jgi:hypothetical protein
VPGLIFEPSLGARFFPVRQQQGDERKPDGDCQGFLFNFVGLLAKLRDQVLVFNFFFTAIQIARPARG